MTAVEAATATHEGLPADLLLDMYTAMLRARRLDERCWILHRQGKIAFHISGMGHEAAQVGIAFAMRRGEDHLLPYYRDLTMVLACGMSPLDVMLGIFGKQGDPSSGGRQMPEHYAHRAKNIYSVSSPVATQVPQAAGVALAEKLRGGDRIAVTCLGEGSTNQGDFHEALTWAGVHKLPLVVVVENNEYAISVPMAKEMAIPHVSDRAVAYGVRGVTVDGLDPIATYLAAREAVDIARSGGGTTLLEARVVRLTPHSSDDDDSTYRSKEDKAALKISDPLPKFRGRLMDAGILSQQHDRELDEQIVDEVNHAHQAAEVAPYPNVEWAAGPVFAP
ncbi:MAG TPA: thiamine pyrophosphate-dependent dehydrogenase E1 component subunit alpha [Anaerolineae bacterium]|nr:thiamine pyrophosphate-dependent dehydrogenase E1 component subunit alpha [Anaerolineae bacterium]